MSDSVELAVRLVLSLAFVIALMWVAARVVRGQIAGRGGGAIEVLARHQLGRGSSVAVLRVADQALVVGVSESRVTLLTEADLEVVQAMSARATPSRSESRATSTSTTVDRNGRPVGTGSGAGSSSGSSAGRSAGSSAGSSALHGSIVSPSTWRQALEALRDRTARKG